MSHLEEIHPNITNTKVFAQKQPRKRQRSDSFIYFWHYTLSPPNKILKSSIDDSFSWPKFRKAPTKILYSDDSLNSTIAKEPTRRLRSSRNKPEKEPIEKEPSRMSLRNRTVDRSSFFDQSSKSRSTTIKDKEKQSSIKPTSRNQAKKAPLEEDNQRQTRSKKKNNLKQPTPKAHVPLIRSKSRINTSRKKILNRSKSESDARKSSKHDKNVNPIICPKTTKKNTRKWFIFLFVTLHTKLSSHTSVFLTFSTNILQVYQMWPWCKLVPHGDHLFPL